MFGRIARFSVRWRWPVAGAWVAAAIAVPLLLPSLSSVVQNSDTAFLPPDTPIQHAARLGAAFMPAGEIPVPVVVVSDRPLGAPAAAYGQRLAQLMRQVPDVGAVRYVGVSPDARAVELQVLTTAPAGPGTERTNLIDGLRAAVRRADAPPGVSAHVTGDLAAQVDQAAASGNTGNTVMELSAVLILVILLLIFRAVLAPIVTLLPALLAARVAEPVVAVIAHHGLKVSTLAQLMLIVLVLGAGTDYGLFLVFRVREQLRAGMDVQPAVVAAVERVGESVAASAGTVIVALLSLFAATFGVYHDLGPPLAIGIVLTLLAALTALPALLAIAGQSTFWPAPLHRAERGGWWGAAAVALLRRPAAALLAGAALLGGLAVGNAGYRLAGFGGATTGPPGSDSALGREALLQHFPAVAVTPTNVFLRYREPVWQDPAPLRTATAALRGSPVFTGVTGPLDPTGQRIPVRRLIAWHHRYGDFRDLAPLPPRGVSLQTWQLLRAEAGHISPDGRTLAFDVALRAGDPSTTAALHAVPAIRAAAAHAAAASGAVDQGVLGAAPGLYDVSTTSAADLRRVVPIAVAVIAVLLAAVVRSLIAPLYLVASVALSYLATLGLCVLVFQDLLGDGGITFILPFLMFLFLLALGEDYNILVMARIREEAHHRPLREAVTTAVRVTGSTVTSAGLVLATTFAVFAVAGTGSNGGPQIRDIGIGLAVGILLDTFLVRSVLVPATVILLGRWNWWPSRLARMAGTAAAGGSVPTSTAAPPDVERVS